MTSFVDQFSTLKIPNLGLVRFPEVTITPEDRVRLGLKPNMTNRAILGHLAWNGYKQLAAKGFFGAATEEEVRARFNAEFVTFDCTGVHDYLLLVWDINRWADSQGIVRGWGRGSAASSLTLCCLGITRVDPIRHKLVFPRFISEARMKPVVKDGVTYVDGKAAPDIDCDYQYGRRVEVIRYIEQKHPGKTCKISTRLELTGKTALKNALKVYAAYKDEDAQRVSDMIEARFGKVQTLHEAREQNEPLKAWLAASEANQRVYAIAMMLEGAPVAKGQHPSGVFVGYWPLDGTVPTELAKEKGGEPVVVTSYDMETVAGIGTKVDILGVRTLDIVAGTAKEAGIPIDSIDVDDPLIYEYLNRPEAHYVGLFQIEEGTTKEAVVKVGPKDIEALCVCTAISRPGALKYLPQYVEYYRKGILKTIYPAIDEVLKPTGNVLVYQEQITAICHLVFALSLIDADSVRYAVGKKKREEMVKWEPVLAAGAEQRGVPADVTKYFWEVCNASADYLFCLGHAVPYVYLTAATVYLKARAPQAFYLTMLRLAKEEPDSTQRMTTIIGEMTKVGVQLLPPDILRSEMDFALDGSHIRFGLASIKGISELTFAKLPALRGQTFATKWDLFDAAKAAKIQINMLSALIYSGTLSWLATSRIKLALEAQTYNILSDGQKVKVKGWAAKTGTDDIVELIKGLAEAKTEKGKPLLAADQVDRIRRDHAPHWRAYLSNAVNESLSNVLFERRLLGFSFSGTLLSVFSQKVHGLISLADLKQRGEAFAKQAPPEDGSRRERAEPVKAICFVAEAWLGVSRANGSPYLKLELTDDTGTFMAMCYGEERLEATKSFNGRLPEEGDLLLATGGFSKDGRLWFLDSAIIQSDPTCLSKRDVDKQDVPV